MKRISVILLSLLFFFPSIINAKKVNKETMQWRYEVQDLGIVAKDGKSVIFKIWTYASNEKNALMQAGKNAVHAVVFKQIGYNPALAGTEAVETENEEFFQTFFKDGGEYQRFFQYANNGAIAAGDNIKLKGEYKIGVRVTVNRADLRKYLEERGIIKAMNSMF